MRHLMTFAAWQQPLTSLFLAVALLVTGCVAPGTRAAMAGGGTGDDAALYAGADGAPAGPSADPHGLRPVRHHHAAKWIAAGFLLAFVVTIDLLILPFTAHHHPFPCCRAVIHLCH